MTPPTNRPDRRRLPQDATRAGKGTPNVPATVTGHAARGAWQKGWNDRGAGERLAPYGPMTPAAGQRHTFRHFMARMWMAGWLARDARAVVSFSRPPEGSADA